MNEPRRTALEILKNIIEKKLFFSEAKNAAGISSAEDSAFVNMLVLTTLRHLVFIKKALKKFVKKKLPADVVAGEFALFLGTAEILYLNTPDYAVINSYVDLVKRADNKYVAGFVNAVLRNVCRQKDELKAADAGEFFPAGFFKILNRDYGKKTVQKIQKSSAKEPCLDITAKHPDQALAAQLGGKLLPNGSIRLPAAGRVDSLPGYNEGLWWVQDFSASLAAKALTDINGRRVLDLCAAPGGKTAQLLNAGAKVTALDISEKRLQTLRENLRRLCFEADIICADGLEYLKNFRGEKFDAVLLDAPCSATGTIRRHPELVHIKKDTDIEKQADLQKQFLNLAGNALKSGGILVYCVCSVTRAEGEEQIKAFLDGHPEFANLPIKAGELFADNTLDRIITPEGFVRTLPQHLDEVGGCDSFFIARMQKVK